jgi:hypothetical protein
MLKDIAVTVEKGLEYNLKGETWSTSQLYLSCLNKYNSNGYKKIVINLVKATNKNDIIDDMIDVIVINKIFDFDTYHKLTGKYEKKEMLLKVLHNGIMTLADIHKWDINPLLDSYNCCLKKRLLHSWLRDNKYFISPDKKYYAGIYCVWDIDKFQVFAIFLNNNKQEIEQVKLYEREPWDVDPLGKMGWTKDSSIFYLLSKDGRNEWIASVSKIN